MKGVPIIKEKMMKKKLDDFLDWAESSIRDIESLPKKVKEEKLLIKYRELTAVRKIVDDNYYQRLDQLIERVSKMIRG